MVGILGGAVGGATISIIIKAVDQYSKDFNKLNKDLQKQQTGFQKLTGILKDTGIGYAALTGAAFGFGVQSVKAYLQTERAAQSFNIVVGDTADILLNDLKKASKGMVSDFDLMQAANRALMLGIEQNQLPQLMEMSAALGKIMGRTVTEAFNDITIGIGRQSKLILDNLGIIVNAEDAYKRYAFELGKTANQLTEVERKQAFTNAVIEQGTALTEAMRYATETHTEKLQRLIATWENVKSAMGKAIIESYDWIESLGKAIVLYDIFADDIKSPEILTKLNDIANQIRKITDNTKILSQENEAYMNDLKEKVSTIFPKEISLEQEKLVLQEKLIEKYGKVSEKIVDINKKIEQSKKTTQELLSSLSNIQAVLAGESEKNIIIAEKEHDINVEKLRMLEAGEIEETDRLKQLQNELDILRLQRDVEFSDIKNIEQAKNDMFIAEQKGLIETIEQFKINNELKKKTYLDEMNDLEKLERKRKKLADDESDIEHINKLIDAIDKELDRYDMWRTKQNLIVQQWKISEEQSTITMDSVKKDIQGVIDKYDTNRLAIERNTLAIDALTTESKIYAERTISDGERIEALFTRIYQLQKKLGGGGIQSLFGLKNIGDLIGVGDAIIRPNGDIIKTHPQDTLIATKTPNKMGGLNIYINNLNGFNAKDIAHELQSELNNTIRL